MFDTRGSSQSTVAPTENIQTEDMEYHIGEAKKFAQSGDVPYVDIALEAACEYAEEKEIAISEDLLKRMKDIRIIAMTKGVEVSIEDSAHNLTVFREIRNVDALDKALSCVQRAEHYATGLHELGIDITSEQKAFIESTPRSVVGDAIPACISVASEMAARGAVDMSDRNISRALQFARDVGIAISEEQTKQITEIKRLARENGIGVCLVEAGQAVLNEHLPMAKFQIYRAERYAKEARITFTPKQNGEIASVKEFISKNIKG